jgi:hypothetical protein
MVRLQRLILAQSYWSCASIGIETTEASVAETPYASLSFYGRSDDALGDDVTGGIGLLGSGQLAARSVEGFSQAVCGRIIEHASWCKWNNGGHWSSHGWIGCLLRF